MTLFFFETRERYNELLDATDSINHMKFSIDDLIKSLQGLSSVIEKTQTIVDNEQQISVSKPKEYTEAILSRILFDFPLQVCLVVKLIV